MIYDLAVLLTCHNRKAKTINALKTLFESFEYYNNKTTDTINVSVFLTDDGCSDGTAQEVEEQFGTRALTVIRADGNAYWAGGMRLAWKEALKSKHDFYLLINDDTFFKLECIDELFNANEFALNNYGKCGVYSGFVSSINDESIITYGAQKYTNSFLSKAEQLKPTGTPQECMMTNANILLVSNNVVSIIGILDKSFIHSAADLDYGIRASKKGFPVLTTSGICGYCEYDHDNSMVEREKVLRMSFKERKKFLDLPHIKQYHDSSLFYWRYDKIRFFLLKGAYLINLFFPSLYYAMYSNRKH